MNFVTPKNVVVLPKTTNKPVRKTNEEKIKYYAVFAEYLFERYQTNLFSWGDLSRICVSLNKEFEENRKKYENGTLGRELSYVEEQGAVMPDIYRKYMFIGNKKKNTTKDFAAFFDVHLAYEEINSYLNSCITYEEMMNFTPIKTIKDYYDSLEGLTAYIIETGEYVDAFDKNNVRGKEEIKKEVKADEVKEEYHLINESVSILSKEDVKVLEKSVKTGKNDWSIYVPSVDEKYVPYGDAYKFIKQILSDKVFMPTYVYGASGVGKTSMIKHICALLQKPFFRCQITAETVDSDLIGSYKLQDGNTVWEDGIVIKAYKSGGCLVLDEVDLNSSLLVLQPILEGEPFYIKETGELVYPQEGFMVVATGNTKGDGGNAKYIGTTVLNDAFLERFCCIFKQELPSASTDELIIDNICNEIDFKLEDKSKKDLLQWIQAMKANYQKAEEYGEDAIYISARRLGFILKIAKMYKGNLTKAINFALTRYNDDVKDAMMMMWKAINSNMAEKSE